ncbi:AAA family ATPase, partial [Xanthomonas arboricola]|uniref:AAA family ATPase n=1 Tax=Xanthomonas arboricola TaxID=56448 RepID=UPI004040A674
MISEISILNHKSFHPTQPTRIVLETEGRKPVFFYGQNGAGKTAIGEVIRGLAVGDSRFAGCQVTTLGEGRFRFHVYNHDFVQSVIGEADGMPGIFTIGETDGATQKEIERQEQAGKDADEAMEAARVRIEDIDSRLDKALVAAQDETWKAYKAHDAGEFATYLKGYGRGKPKFFEDLRKQQVSPDEELDDISELLKRLADVSGNEQSKSKHSLSTSGFSLIEAHDTWQEVVEVSNDSSLAALIDTLKNGDWVDKGRSFIQGDQCPFCQRGLPHGFMDELVKLFQGTRQEKIDSIASYVTSYATGISDLERKIESALAEPLAEETELKIASEAVVAKLKANLATMRLKQERPGESFEIASVDMGLLTAALGALNARIEDFNRRIANKSEERKAVGEAFWKILFRDRVDAYTAYDAAVAPLNEQRNEWVIKQRAAMNSKSEATASLIDLKKTQEGVDASVAAINTRLKGLGIETFSIDRKDGDGSLYCLKRPNLGASTTQSLSEGEKTLISFFYFMELLKGSAEQGQSIDLARTIVVIDRRPPDF